MSYVPEKGWFWPPSVKPQADSEEPNEEPEVEWSKPVRLIDERVEREYLGLADSPLTYAKQRTVQLTGSRPGRYAQVPANPKKRDPDHPTGP